MSLPPLPDDIEQEIYGRCRYFVPEAAQKAVLEMMREYGLAVREAALEEAAELAEMRDALIKIRAHTGRTDAATFDLLNGLLDSIQRIADAALAKEKK